MASTFESLYPNPEKYKIIPDSKVLFPFGVNYSNGESSISTGVFFGKPGVLLYDIYSPIECDKFSFSNGILSLEDTRIGLLINIYKIRELRDLKTKIKRGTLLGRAGEIRSSKGGVYVEGRFTTDYIKNSLESRFGSLGDKIDLKAYLFRLSESFGTNSKTFTNKILKLVSQQGIEKLSPLFIEKRVNNDVEMFFNYCSLFY